MFQANQQFNHATNFFLKNVQLKDFIHHRQIKITANHTHTLFQFETAVKVSPLSGLALLVFRENQQYLLDGEYILAPNTTFNILSLSDDVLVQLSTKTPQEPQLITIENDIHVTQHTVKIQVQELLTAVSYQFQEFHQIEVKAQAHYELLFVESGQLTINQATLTKGQAILIAPNTTYQRLYDASEKCLVHTIRFNATGIDKRLVNTILDISTLIAPLLDLMHQDFTAPLQADYLSLHVHSLLIALNQRLIEPASEQTTSMQEKYEDELFAKIIDFIHSSDITTLKVSDLVQQFNISRSTLQHLFNKYQHVTPKIYINQLRLEKSRQLIRESNLSITEIATQLGYGSLQYFSRAFSNTYNVSPSEYAKGYAKRL
ncbi:MULTISPECIES: helix-turn-helix transcriptional regulator [unclassified Facklamia]|uniref:helix-turn-helix transcriptional regulator n=1 Tax=Aerococcaceae TaxID=186827 RepID=UPI0013D2D57C|nr:MULTISPECIES: helix-turn-helix transcriptional regulator [unclassified Facklamia]QQD66336.1 helix-turn-helix transcriptional regulator [Aerococcaceae bacterium zg-252]